MPNHSPAHIEELRDTIGKLSFALDSIMEAIVWSDPQGCIQWSNRVFYDMLGLPSIAVLGRQLTEVMPLKEHGTLLPPEGHPERLACRHGSTVRGLYEFGGEDRKIQLDFSSNCIEIFPAGKSTISIIRDVSRIAETEQARLQSAALRHAANAIAITDAQGRVSWVNPAFTGLTGFALEEIYGKTLRILKSGRHDRDFYHNLWSTIQSGRVWQGEMVNRRKNGTFYTERQTITPLMKDGGRITNFIAIKEDVSERKKAEEELATYQKHLEQMVQEKSRELEKAQDELIKRAMEAGMSQMAAIGLHNIGNAITPLNVLLEGAQSDELGKLSHYLQKCHADLRAHADRLGPYVLEDPRGRQVFAYMEELIRSLADHEAKQTDLLGKMSAAIDYVSELLTLQHAYATGAEVTRDKVDLNALLEDAFLLQSGALQKRGIAVRRSYPKSLPRLTINRNRLMQVVLNLIKNAYESIEAKMGAPGEGVIEISSFNRAHWLGFEIRDNGIGIEPVDIEKLGTLGSSQKGSSGFGLYYCRMFVEGNGGRLCFSSPGLGQGAAVSVTFDLNEVGNGK